MNNLDYNKLHGWAIEKELVELIDSKLPEGKVILEFGSGTGTDVLLERYHVISVEHDINFVCRRSDNHLCFFAPLENNWYPRNVICEILKMKYDLILIDGPPRELRRGILQNLDLFEGNGHAIVIFDDINRDLDRDIMILFCRRLNYSHQIIKGSKKMFALCEKRMTEYDRSNHINLLEKKAINSFLSQTIFRELYNKCSRRDYIYNFSIFFYLGILKSYSPNSHHLERNINNLLDMTVPYKCLSGQSQGTLTIRNKVQIIVTYNIVFKQFNKSSRLTWLNDWISMCSSNIIKGDSTADLAFELFSIVNNQFRTSFDKLVLVLDYIKAISKDGYHKSFFKIIRNFHY